MRFCVECGKDIEKAVNGLCFECFLRDRTLLTLPNHVDLETCTECGFFHRHGDWEQMRLDKAITQSAREALKCIKEGKITDTEFFIDHRDDYNHQVSVKATVDVEGYEAEGEATTIVRIKNAVCPICSRRTGNYYESILQVRTSAKIIDEELMDRALARVEKLVDDAATTDQNAFITKMEKVPGGIDVYLSLIALGRACCKDLANIFCAETDESSKLVGQTRDGLDMYRVSYLVRLPEFKIGDIVIFKKKYYLLKRVSSAGGRLISLKDFQEMPIKRKEMPEMKVHSKGSETQNAILVSRSEKEIQIMDPETYATVDVKIPQGAELGETVRVIRIDGALNYIPDF